MAKADVLRSDTLQIVKLEAMPQQDGTTAYQATAGIKGSDQFPFYFLVSDPQSVYIGQKVRVTIEKHFEKE